MAALADGALGALRVSNEHRLSRATHTTMRTLRRYPLAYSGALILMMVAICALFPSWIAPHDPYKIEVTAKLADISSGHPFGTDILGRDVLSRIIYGARVTIFIDLIAVAVALCIALFCGCISGFRANSPLDLVLQRLVDAWMSFPAMVLALSIMLSLGQGKTSLIIVIGLIIGMPGIRVIRAAALGVKSSEYIFAAEVLGTSPTRILWRHILPNVLPVAIVMASVSLGSAILIETSLSFLGYGIMPPDPSWGQMLGQQSLQYFYIQPLLSIWPGAVIGLTVFAFNAVGDGLRDALDPKVRRNW